MRQLINECNAQAFSVALHKKVQYMPINPIVNDRFTMGFIFAVMGA